jgi:hypothetical protein
MRHPAGLLASLLLLSISGDPAAAGSVEIVYEITGGSFGTPPGGSVTGGGYTLRLQANGPLTPVSGPAALETFSLRGTDQTVYYGNVLTSHFTVVLTKPVGGGGTVASGFRNSALAVLTGPVHIHCSGPNCAMAGFPPSVSQSFPLRNAAMPSGVSLYPSGGRASGTYQIAGTTDFFSLSFMGREVERTFVPEPDSRGLALAAVVGLVALWRATHGRRSRLGSGS